MTRQSMPTLVLLATAFTAVIVAVLAGENSLAQWLIRATGGN